MWKGSSRYATKLSNILAVIKKQHGGIPYPIPNLSQQQTFFQFNMQLQSTERIIWVPNQLWESMIPCKQISWRVTRSNCHSFLWIDQFKISEELRTPHTSTVRTFLVQNDVQVVLTVKANWTANNSIIPIIIYILYERTRNSTKRLGIQMVPICFKKSQQIPKFPIFRLLSCLTLSQRTYFTPII